MEESKAKARSTATTQVKTEYQPFPSDQTEIQLINDDGFAIESLGLDDNDPIFAMSFR